MSYNENAIQFQSQIVISDTTNASISNASLMVAGGLSSKDTYITGHVAVNNVKITPNLNDIIFEQQATLNITEEFTDITDFYFDNSIANSFKAIVNVNVNVGLSKYAVWEINGLYKPTGWVITSSFTGDLTGVNFRITNSNGRGQIQYTNSNNVGSTTTIRYRATTTAPVGTTPTGSVGIINNTNGPYIANTLLYSNTVNTLASTDLVYDSNVFTIGGNSRILARNANSFTNFSNGGAITSMGDASVAKELIVGQKIGIANTNPSFTLDVSGDINFTGNFYKNNSLYSGSSIWQTNNTDVFYTQGNLGIGTSSPSYTLDVSGGARITTSLTTGAVFSTNLTSTNIVTTSLSSGTLVGTTLSTSNVYSSIGTITNMVHTNLSSGTLTVTNISSDSLYSTISSFGTVSSSLLSANTMTGGNISLSGDLNVAGTLTVVNITSTNMIETNITTVTLLATTSVSSGILNATNTTVTNAVHTTLSSGTLVGTTLSTGNVHSSLGTITNMVHTALSTGTLTVTNITTDTLLATTSISSGSIQGTNIIATNSSLGTINAIGATIGGNLVPSENITYDLGSSSLRWKDLYLSGNTIHLGEKQLSLAGDAFTVEKINITSTDETVSSTSGALVIDGGMGISKSLTVNGTVSSSLVSSASIHGTDSTITNAVHTTLSSGNATLTTATIATLSNTNAVSTNISAATLNLSTGLTSASAQITNANVTTLTAATLLNTNAISTNVSAATLTLSTGLTAASAQITNVTVTNLSAGTLRNTNAVSTNVSAATLTLSTGLTAASAQITNANVTNLSAGTLSNTNAVSTNVSAATLNLSTGLTAASAQITNANVTNLSAGTLSNTNAVSTNVSAATLTLSTGLTAASAQITNANVTNLSAGTLSNTNAVSTNVSAATLTLSTGLTAASAQITNANVTNLSAGTLSNTNAVSTNVSAATLTLSTGLTAASAQITNANVTNLSAGTLSNTNAVSTNISAATLTLSTGLTAASAQITTLTASTINSTLIAATTITSGSVSLSGNLNVAGTLTVVNITSTNLMDTNLTAGIARITTNLAATGNSNTIGSIITTSGNVGIGTSSPGSALHVAGSIGASPSGIGVLMGVDSVNDASIIQINQSNSTTGVCIIDFGYTGNNYQSRIIHSNSNDSLTFSVNGGASSMTLASSGNVGIGISAPAYNLDVNGNARFSTGLTTGNLEVTGLGNITNLTTTTATIATLRNTNAITTNVSAGTLNLSTGLTSASAQITNANVTTSTIATLLNTNAVSTNVSAATLNLSTGVTTGSLQAELNTGLIALRPDGSNGNLLRYGGGGAKGDTLRFVGITDIERMRINNNGLVGINTTDPTDLLTISNGNITLSSSTSNGFLFNKNSLWGGIEAEGTTTQLVNIGVNTNRSKPWNSTSASGWFRIDIREDYPLFQFYTKAKTSGTETMLACLESTGSFGIGTSSPAYLLDVNGDARISTGITTGGLEVSGLGNITNLTTTTSTIATLRNTNAITTNVSAATLNLSTGTTTGTIRVTGNADLTGGVVSATNVSTTSLTSANAVFTTGTTTGTIRVTGNADLTGGVVSATNVSTTSLTSANAVFTTGTTTGTIRVTGNADLTGGVVSATNVSTTSLTSANAVFTTGTTTGTIRVTGNADLTGGVVSATNVSTTSLTSANAVFTTGITSASAQITNANVTTSTIATLRNTNAITTNVSAATLNLSTGITTGTIRVTGNADLTGGVVSATNITTTTLSATSSTITNLSVPGTLTVVNITSTNLVDTTISTNSVIVNNNNNSVGIQVGVGTSNTTSNLILYGPFIDGYAYIQAGSTTNLTSSNLRFTRFGTADGTLANFHVLSEKSAFIGGNVGINTTAPQTNLHINDGGLQLGAGNTSGFHFLGQNGGLNAYSGTWGAGITRFCCDSRGNFGIGTLNPNYLMSLVKAGDTRYHLYNSASIAEWTFGQKSSARSDFTFTKVVAGTETDYFTISTGGNIGIGTTSPAHKLDVIGTIDATTYTGANIMISGSIGSLGSIDAGSQFLGQANDTISAPSFSWTGDTNTGMYRPATDTLGFVTNGVERMRVSSSGNIGINTNSPTTAKLVISGSNGAIGLDLSSTDQYAEMRVIRNSLSSIDKDMWLQNGAGSGSKLRLYSNNTETMVLNSGNVGIGTSAPGYKLHVSGDIYSSGDITAFSDIRLKENIVQLSGCLDKIDNIRGVSFNRIDTGSKHIGLIAQEVEAEFPQLVATDLNSGFKSINYGNVVAVLLECIRELKVEVNKINSRIAL